MSVTESGKAANVVLWLPGHGFESAHGLVAEELT